MRYLIVILLAVLAACASTSDDEMIVDSGAPFMVDFVPPIINGGGQTTCNVQIVSGTYWYSSEDPGAVCPIGMKCTLIREDGTYTTGCTVTQISGRRYCRCQ